MQPQEAGPSPLALGRRASHNLARHTPLRNFAFHTQAFHKAAVVERRVAAAVDRVGRIVVDTAERRVAAVVGKAGRTADRVAADTAERMAADRVGRIVVDTAAADRAERMAATDTVVDRAVVDRVADNSMSTRSAVRDTVVVRTAVVRTAVVRTAVVRTEEDIVVLDIGAQRSRKVPGDRLGNTLELAAFHRASLGRAEDSSRVD